ncbi:MAG TPA: hypothetical protein VLI21_11105 [Casimicrobiaceae bacterium]|nr:hypothetical protein [Casimicrobiaceae bacterium]
MKIHSSSTATVFIVAMWCCFASTAFAQKPANRASLIAGWRNLDYNFKSSSKIDDMSLSGPMFGVALLW